MADDRDSYVTNPDQILTKDLLKMRRQQAYRAAKARARAERIAVKENKNIERQEERAERDRMLLSSLLKGSDLKEKDP